MYKLAWDKGLKNWFPAGEPEAAAGGGGREEVGGTENVDDENEAELLGSCCREMRRWVFDEDGSIFRVKAFLMNILRYGVINA